MACLSREKAQENGDERLWRESGNVMVGEQADKRSERVRVASINASVAWETHPAKKSGDRRRGRPCRLFLEPLPPAPALLSFLLLVLSSSYTHNSLFLPRRELHKMSPTPNPLFKFNRDGFSVHISNVADAGLSIPFIPYPPSLTQLLH